MVSGSYRATAWNKSVIDVSAALGAVPLSNDWVITLSTPAGSRNKTINLLAGDSKAFSARFLWNTRTRLPQTVSVSASFKSAIHGSLTSETAILSVNNEIPPEPGTEPEPEPTPNNTMVAVDFSSNWNLQFGKVSGTAILNKTNTFDSFFNDKLLQIVAQAFHIATGNFINNKIIDVGFGSNTQRTIDVSIDIGSIKDVRVTLHARLKSTGEFMSLTDSQEFTDIVEPPPIPEPPPPTTDPRVGILITNQVYERLAEGSEQGAVRSNIQATPNQDAVGLDVIYVVNVKDFTTNKNLVTTRTPVTLNNSNNPRDITALIANFDLHPKVKVTWQILNPVTLGVFDTFQQNLDVQVPPPPQKMNTSFTVTFSDASVESYILSDTDFAIVTARPPDVRFFVSAGVDTSLDEITLAQFDILLAAKLATLPVVFPPEESFTQRFTAVDYINETTGKHLFVQIQFDRLKATETNVTAFIQLRNQAGIPFHIEPREINMNGVNATSIVWDFPDLGSLPNPPTATITVEHFIRVSQTDDRALALPISAPITIRNPDTPPPPLPPSPSQPNIMSKLFGLFAAATAITILGSKRN